MEGASLQTLWGIIHLSLASVPAFAKIISFFPILTSEYKTTLYVTGMHCIPTVWRHSLPGTQSQPSNPMVLGESGKNWKQRSKDGTSRISAGFALLSSGSWLQHPASVHAGRQGWRLTSLLSSYPNLARVLSSSLGLDPAETTVCI